MEDSRIYETHSIDAPIENQFPVDIQAPLLDRIDMLIEAAKDSKLSDDFFAKYRDLILSVAVNLQLSMEQAVLLMPFISNPDESIMNRDLKRFFDCSATTIMRYSDNLTRLVHRRYIHHKHQYGGCGLKLTQKANKALSSGVGLKEVSLKNLDPNEFMKALSNLYEELLSNGHILREEFHDELKHLLEQNKHLEIVKAFTNLKLDYESTVFCSISANAWSTKPSQTWISNNCRIWLKISLRTAVISLGGNMYSSRRNWCNPVEMNMLCVISSL
jgi:hypothetical protein